MNDQQLRTLRVQTYVKQSIAIENLLTVIAKEALFADVTTDELITTVIKNLTIDEDTKLDMVAYLDSERNKATD